MFNFFKTMTGSQTLTAAEAQERIKANPQAIILDVREGSEYQSGHIKHARLIPLYQLEARAAAELPDRQAEILVYCLSGARAVQAVRVLHKLGYDHAVSFGGLMDWPYGLVR
ncbi:MAG: rhodanese-like domain-containing protein [Oscillospiraceae bacterium]|nr:rhodanese-like domain-containing protein [Oscillospiraceae bacterium]MDD4367537.1 rhodanese-like domain-containing protein [Oscillospiraceae bacterium]